MDIKIENFIAPKNIETIKTAGMHKIVGAIEGGEEITIKRAAQLIGTKAYQRRREFQKISAGIAALAAVTEG